MTRPSNVKPDNIFLLLFKALRQRRNPIALRIVTHSLLLVAVGMAIYASVMGLQFKQAMQQQADAVGHSLLEQTATSATELLVADDVLSLNVLLNNLVKNPLVAHAAIFSADQKRTLAEAGKRPSRSEEAYSQPITFQSVTAGHLQLTLDRQQFQMPMIISLQSMGILSLILLALTLSLSLRLGRQIATPLQQLRLWLREPDDPAPGHERQDELGDLSRQLQQRLVPEKQLEPEALLEQEPDERLTVPAGRPLAAEQDDDELWPEVDDDQLPELDIDKLLLAADEQEPPSSATQTAVLAIQLGAQEQLRRLPRTRLNSLLQRYQDALEQATDLYQGQRLGLNDGGSLLLFHAADSRDYLINAICCAELMRSLGQAIQLEMADSGTDLQLQLGLTLGEHLQGLSPAELLLSEAAQSALALSLHSRNLLLLDQEVADAPQVREKTRIRTLAKPEGACCVERLLGAYPVQLESQLSRIRENPNG